MTYLLGIHKTPLFSRVLGWHTNVLISEHTRAAVNCSQATFLLLVSSLHNTNHGMCSVIFIVYVVVHLICVLHLWSLFLSTACSSIFTRLAQDMYCVSSAVGSLYYCPTFILVLNYDTIYSWKANMYTSSSLVQLGRIGIRPHAGLLGCIREHVKGLSIRSEAWDANWNIERQIVCDTLKCVLFYQYTILCEA
jgi:hypothetical protein